MGKHQSTHFRTNELYPPFKKGWGYCEGNDNNRNICRCYTPNQYKRIEGEKDGWHPLMTIYLCEDCAKNRIPYTIEEANKIADKIRNEFLQQAC